MNLHNEIMNIPVDHEKPKLRFSRAIALKLGDKEARYAAAELGLKKAALIQKLLDALEARPADDYVDAVQLEYSL